MEEQKMKHTFQMSRRDSLRCLGAVTALAARPFTGSYPESYAAETQPAELTEPAPEWLRKAEMVTNWRPGTLDRLVGIPLIINVQQKEWADAARASGFRTITYNGSAMDMLRESRRGEQNQRLVIGPDNANGLLVNEKGDFVNTLMDGTYRLERMLVCSLSTTYVQKMDEFLKKVLTEVGSDGLFMDDISPRRVECYGEGLRIGYSKRYRTVLAEARPQTFEDPRIRDVPIHRHLYRGQDQAYGLRQLLLGVRQMVKSYGQDKVMIINGDPEYADCADGTMVESYICSWGWKGRNKTWTQLKELAQQYARYIKSGGTVIALSYLGETQTTVKDDAFFCYAAARLSDFIWSDYQTLGDNPATVLYHTQLGQPTNPLMATDKGAEYRWFEKGLIVMNGTDQNIVDRIELPDNGGFPSLADLYAEQEIAVAGGRVNVSVPAQAGRVYSAS